MCQELFSYLVVSPKERRVLESHRRRGRRDLKYLPNQIGLDRSIITLLVKFQDFDEVSLRLIVFIVICVHNYCLQSASCKVQGAFPFPLVDFLVKRRDCFPRVKGSVLYVALGAWVVFGAKPTV